MKNTRLVIGFSMRKTLRVSLMVTGRKEVFASGIFAGYGLKKLASGKVELVKPRGE